MDANNQVMSNVNIVCGTISGVAIGGLDMILDPGDVLDASNGTLVLADDQISGDKVGGGTIAAITISQLSGHGCQ